MTIQIGIQVLTLAVMIGMCSLAAADAELRVYAPGGVRSALQAAAAFERETSHTIQFTFGTGKNGIDHAGLASGGRQRWGRGWHKGGFASTVSALPELLMLV